MPTPTPDAAYLTAGITARGGAALQLQQPGLSSAHPNTNTPSSGRGSSSSSSGGGRRGTRRGGDEMIGRQVFLPLSLINHSCSPNCEVDMDGGHGWVTATSHIPSGTALSITYIDLEQPRSARRALLRKLYSFDCDCVRCEAELVERPGKAVWSQQGTEGRQPAAKQARDRRLAVRGKGGGEPRNARCSTAVQSGKVKNK
ncbi:hypothetical protein V8C86DRAFT_2742829 [Haematococcus lacustris]